MPPKRKGKTNSLESSNNNKKKKDSQIVSKELKDSNQLADDLDSMEVEPIARDSSIPDEIMSELEFASGDGFSESKVQQWLDKKYSEKREEITEINTKDWSLESENGELKFEKFPNLKSITLTKEIVKNIKKLEFTNLPKLEKIKFDLGFQDGSEDPKKKVIEGIDNIKLTDLPKLEAFLANHCRLKSAEIDNCPEINDLRIGNNRLSDTAFLSKLNKDKLKVLSIHSNNFTEQDLSFLGEFVNLEELFLDNADQYKIDNYIYNRFRGSLKHLENLKKLKTLSLSNTDIDSGSEHVRHHNSKLEIIKCSTKKRPKSKVKKIAMELSDFSIDEKDGEYDLMINKEWKDLDSKIIVLDEQKQWIEKGFTPRQTELWIKADLKDAKLASYLKSVGHDVEFWKSPFNKEKKEKLEEIYRDLETWKKKGANDWLEKEYPKKGKCLGNFDWENKGKERGEIEELDISSEELEGKLDLEGFKELRYLICHNNKLVEINLSDCSSLIVINCGDNELNKINFAQKLNLKEFRGSNNKFIDISDILNHINSEKLTYFNISNNHIIGKISEFNNFSELESLYVNDNPNLVGSLKDLKDLKNLLDIGIQNTKIEVNYLNDLNEEKTFNKLEKIYCEEDIEGVLEVELSGHYNKDNNFYDIKTRMDDKKMSESVEVETIIRIPLLLDNKTGQEVGRIKEDYVIKEMDYFERGKLIYPSEMETGFIWNLGGSVPLSKLPLRLCRINSEGSERKERIEIKKRIECADDAKHYAILSYSWGGKHREDIKWSPEKAEERLSQGGIKSLKKAIQTLKTLNKFHGLSVKGKEIKYFWMDQLCVNQNNDKEKSHEIPKMREYYGNSTVTLVAIHANVGEENIRRLSKSFEKRESGLIYPNEIIKNSLPILEKIIGSEWFSRSWTFQEGFLSKQTIFMFDDFLIDGRFMALIWKLRQFSFAHYEECNNMKKLCEEKAATPVGWAYRIEGYNLRDKASLRLHEALWAVKERGRALPLDGIYSIIGLLPYGEKVKVDYGKDPEFVLREVMLVAIKNKHAEPLAWHGIGSGTPGLCWVPKIDNRGSSSVTGGIKITCKSEEAKLNFTFDRGIEVRGREYLISEKSSGVYKLERDETVEGGLWVRKVLVDVGNKQKEKLTLAGTWEGIKAIGEGRVLIIPNKMEWESDIPFAILALVTNNNKGNNRHRIDLLRIEEGGKKLDGHGEEKNFIVGLDKQEVQIEIPPK